MLASGICASGFARSQSTGQESTDADSFALLDTGGHLQPLERTPVKLDLFMRANCFIGSPFAYQIQGERSTVRWPVGSPLDIVAHLKSMDIDPATLVVLYPLRVTKGQRYSPITCAVHSPIQMRGQLQMKFSKYEQQSLEVTPHTPLLPGEYAVMALGMAYCFGIDYAK